MLSPRSDKQALIFSQIAQMKFKPAQCPLLKQVKQQNESNVAASQFQRLQSTISQFYTPDSINRRIKYLYALNQSYFLIGNQNQLDLIGINGASYGFLDTDYLWSLNLKQMICNLALDIKKCFIAIVLDKSIQIFVYNSKKLNQIPKIYKIIQLKSPVRFIQFAKQAYLSVFYDEYFEVYIMEQNGKLIKKCQKPYGISRDYKLFAVPQAVDSVLNIFFQKQTSQQKTFSLWSMKVIFELVEIKMHPVTKVYDIMKTLKKRVLISNFSRDTFFLNMGCEIIAVKKGFIIDSISVDIQGQQSKLIYLSNEKLLHVDDSKVQLYDIKIDITVKPNRIRIKSIDSLQINQKPPNSKLIDVITFGKDNFAIFFQLRPQYNNYKKGQINYWFALTQYIKKEQKIKKIFNYGMEISSLSEEVIQAKCDMARKIGLQQKQIYLEIWNRTSKNTLEDYKFLLATKDFKTIYNQIEKKLKKQSMSFRQLFNIFQSCLDILMRSVFSSNQFTQQNIQEYLTCHLLVRKLKLFKEIQMYQRNQQSRLNQSSRTDFSQAEQQSSVFMITIQQFYEYKNFDIKGYLIDHVNMFCHQKKNTITKIRLILRTFRFVYRVIYRELLQEIIISAKSNLLAFLQAVPEILPHLRYVTQDEQVSLYEGIWKDINESQWQSNLHIQKIKTIDNAQKVDDIIQSVWYKRYWLTTHDLVHYTKNQILQIHRQNVSQEIFYFFISSIFLKVQDRKNLEVLVEFLQNFYQNLPHHIRGKIFLYVDLWAYYCKHHDEAKRQKLSLDQFLKLKGHDLFKYFFDLEKVRKNCILKQIKPIYLAAKSQFAGIDIFNQCLLEYFESDLSQLSDLKYILNRMNNQKSEFHGTNVETYEILVQAMQIKLTIGGKNDIPIEQILIYIENIPLSKDNDVMAELEVVQRINQESERFRQMKLNMSIRQIIDNCQDVISKVIEYEFKKHKIMRIKQISQLQKVSYALLAEIQTVKQKIYGDDMNNLPFFIYISQILQNQNQIDLAYELLHDEYLNRYFTVNETIIQNLVLYMYKKRFSISSIFKDHTNYIKKLVTLLPENNNTRSFILSQLEFALLLSAPGQGVKFPISTKFAFPKVNQLMDIVKFLPAQFILQVNIEKVYQTMHKMQQIEIINNDDDNNSVEDEYFDQQFVTRHQIYEIFITRMIELNLVHDVISYVRQIVKIDFPNQDFNTLYLIMLILRISQQLNDDSKHGLINLLAYAFEDQQQIIKIIQFYINAKITSLQKGKKIISDVDQVIKNKLNYNMKHGYLFKDIFYQQIGQSQQLKQNANILINSTWIHLKNTKPQFKDVFYQLVYIIICHQPYMLAKLIYLLLDNINFKQLRSFISYLSLQEIFDQMKVLEFSKRIFYIVLHSRMENQQINHKLFSYENVPLENQVFFKQYTTLDQEVDIKLQKSLKACQNKSKIVFGATKIRKSRDLSDQQSIHIKIRNPQNITESQPSQYPYQDSDDDQNQQLLSPTKKYRSKAKRAKIQFDQKSQRNKFMNRQGKKLGNYMKQHTDTDNGSQNNLNDAHKSFKIKSRITTISYSHDKQVKVKRAMTLTYNPQISRVKQTSLTPVVESSQAKKRRLMQLMQQQSSVITNQKAEQQPIPSVIKKRSSKRKTSQHISTSKIQKQEQKQFVQTIQKQKSTYTVRQNSLAGTQTTCENLLQDLFEDYDVATKKFDLQKLKTRSKQYADNQKAFIQELRKLVSVLYDSLDAQAELKMTLIKSIATTFEQAGIKQNILSVYIQLLSLIQRYGLNTSLKRLLSIQGLLDQSSTSNLFESSKANIIEVSSIQNLSKLSKVISLAFRKNIYQQQIAYLGLCKIINELQKQQSLDQVEINLHFDQIHQIVTKFSTKMLRQKGQNQFKQIQVGPLKNKLIDLVLNVVGNKGDKISVNALKKALNLSQREIA